MLPAVRTGASPTVLPNDLCQDCGQRRCWGETIYGTYVVCCESERARLRAALDANPAGVIYRAEAAAS